MRRPLTMGRNPFIHSVINLLRDANAALGAARAPLTYEQVGSGLGSCIRLAGAPLVTTSDAMYKSDPLLDSPLRTEGERDFADTPDDIPSSRFCERSLPSVGPNLFSTPKRVGEYRPIK